MLPATLLAESYLHRLNPVALPISDDWGIRWYGIAYLAGFMIAWLLLRWMARTNRSLLSQQAVGDLLVYAVLGVLIGGRLGYATFYRPELFISFSASPPWWELLAIHQGGMASHGGMVGVAVAMLLFARRHALPGLHLLDLVVFVAPPGLFLGRLANFINGELWGKALPASMQSNPPWWSVKYPEEVHFGSIDLTEVAPLVGGDATLHESIVSHLHEGHVEIVSTIVPALTAWWPSQLIQAICEGPVLMAVLAAVWWKARRPGVVTGWFILTYGLLRICTEVVRQPDEGVALVMGLQRGQLLSAVMVAAGLLMIIICARRSAPPVCGLHTKSA